MWSIFTEYQDQTQVQEDLILKTHGEAKEKGIYYLAKKESINTIKQEQEDNEKDCLIAKQDYRK
jgi:hypothetical protein